MTDTDAINAALAKVLGDVPWYSDDGPFILKDGSSSDTWIAEQSPATDYGQALRLAEKERIAMTPHDDPEGPWLCYHRPVSGSAHDHADIRIAIALAVLAKYGIQIDDEDTRA